MVQAGVLLFLISVGVKVVPEFRHKHGLVISLVILGFCHCYGFLNRGQTLIITNPTFHVSFLSLLFFPSPSLHSAVLAEAFSAEWKVLRTGMKSWRLASGKVWCVFGKLRVNPHGTTGKYISSK